MTPWQSLYASRVARIQSSDVREQARLMGQADIISFGGGIPDPAVFPRPRIASWSIPPRRGSPCNIPKAAAGGRSGNG